MKEGRNACRVSRVAYWGKSPGTQHATRKFVAVIITILFLTACGANASAEPVPPDIHFGEDICEFCGMIVSEERYAAGYITRDGQEHVFDDIGDMIQARLQNQDDAVAIFVHDHQNHTWIKAESAHYALSAELPTPMLSGLAAFASVEQAKSFAQELNGQVLTFDQLLTHYQENPPTPALPGAGNTND